jgi:acylphosphatase
LSGHPGAILFRPLDDSKHVKVRAHVFFSGRVQGVFFRAHTRDCAVSLGLTGWVKNTYDGRVEAVFEGEESAVAEAVNWCATRQPYAKVSSREVEMSDATGEFDSFEIAR